MKTTLSQLRKEQDQLITDLLKLAVVASKTTNLPKIVRADMKASRIQEQLKENENVSLRLR